MKKNITIILFLLFGFTLGAQDLTIVEDYEVESLLRKHIDQNKSTLSIPGWRVQLIATTDVRKVENEKSNFLREYPDIHAEWEHNKPYYKLRVGAFATKLDATKLMMKLKSEYPSAFLSKDQIQISELIQ